MRKSWIPVVGLVALLAACTTTTPAVPAGPTLAGTSWTVAQVQGRPTLPGHRPTMKFADGRIAGTTGCNSYGAGYTQSGDSVSLSQAAMTAMACAGDAVMAQEQAFTTALPTITSVRSAGTGLELLDGGAAVVFTLEPVRNKALEGTTWRLSGIASAGSVQSTVAGSEVTMTISGPTLRGKACNTFRGPVTAADGSFAAGPLTSTRMACPSAGLGAQENAVLTTLESATRYAIDGGTLTLSAADGSGLLFTAA